MKLENREAFLSLVRMGVGLDVQNCGFSLFDSLDWNYMETFALQHGLSAIVLDGIERLKGLRDQNVQKVQGPPQDFLLEWIGLVMQDEARYNDQKKTAEKMASLFSKNHIRTYVLKGDVVAECYPKPEHRVSADLDCYVQPDKGEFDAWDFCNDLIKSRGYKVETLFYKNSTFLLEGLTVENHQFLTPFRGNKRLAALEKKLQEILRQDKGGDIIQGTSLYRPPVMVTALFLIEHAYSHLLHEGLTWRMVLDWMMFSRKHEKEIDWKQLEAWIDDFGFRKFYDSYYRLGLYLIGEFQDSSFRIQDKRMLDDIWAPQDLHESVRGWKGKLRLAGNTWRARWKYRYFSEDSMLKALWIQVKGFLFEKRPKLN